MRRLVSHLILTIDGVAKFDAVADAIGALRDTDEVLTHFFRRVTDEDAMLLGRTTYEQWAQYWPTSRVQPFADHINRVPKYVASRTLTSAPWGDRPDASVLDGTLTESVRRLKAQPGGTIGVHGSPTLVESLLQEQLLDELRLEIYPVIAGTGGRLFHDGRPSQRLRLMESTVTSNGVAILSYQPAMT